MKYDSDPSNSTFGNQMQEFENLTEKQGLIIAPDIVPK